MYCLSGFCFCNDDFTLLEACVNEMAYPYGIFCFSEFRNVVFLFLGSRQGSGCRLICSVPPICTIESIRTD